jgi:signal transduction histidine kinase
MGKSVGAWRLLRSLKLKFALLVIALLSLISIALSTVLINQSLDTAKKNLYKSSRAYAELSVKALGNYYSLYYHSGYVRYQTLTKDIYDLEPSITDIKIISVQDGQVLADSQIDQHTVGIPPTIDQKITDSAVLDAIASGTSLYRASRPGGDITQIVLPYQSDFGSRPFSIMYTLSYQEAEAAANQSRLVILLATIIVALLTALVITWSVNRSILSPIGVVIKGAGEIADGNLKQTITVHTHDEIEDLADAVNNMAGKLSENIEELKQLDEAKNEFIMIASHNLRTPLTVLQGYLPLLLDKSKKITVEEQAKFYQAMQSSLARLNKLVEELLSIVNLRQESQMKLSPVSLHAIIESLLSQMTSAIQAQNLKVVTHLDSSLAAKADQTMLTQAISHIIDNAIKFSPNNGEIQIDLSRTEAGPELKITDHGPGMTKEQQDHLFQMFHRENSILNYNYEGVGLGLYIARLTLSKFNASLKIVSKEGQGTSIVILFPKLTGA